MKGCCRVIDKKRSESWWAGVGLVERGGERVGGGGRGEGGEFLANNNKF